MNKTVKRIAVTFVTALLICGVSLNAFAIEYAWAEEFDYWNSSYFVPSPDFPNADSLPYGKDTLVYEIYMRVQVEGYNGWKVHRFYLKKQLYSGSGVSAFNGSTTCFVADDGKFEAFVASESTVYYQTYLYFPVFGRGENVYSFSNFTQAPYYKTKDGKTYNFIVVSGDFASSDSDYEKFFASVRGNAPCYYGGRDLKALVQSQLIHNAPSDELPKYTKVWCLTSSLRSYPTSSDLSLIQNAKNNELLNDRLDTFDSNVVQGFESVNNSINNGVTQVQQAIDNAVDNIINYGSEMPTLDTNNDWMNDSLTKVNEWVSSLGEFKEQMNEAKEENSENMEKAGSFLSGLFEVIPKGIIAVLTLGLVMIVVVKVIGR